MKQNIYDRAVDKLQQRQGLVEKKLAAMYKNTKPFRMEPVTDDELLFVYENASSEDIEYARQTYGDDVLTQFAAEMEKVKARRKLK